MSILLNLGNISSPQFKNSSIKLTSNFRYYMLENEEQKSDSQGGHHGVLGKENLNVPHELQGIWSKKASKVLVYILNKKHHKSNNKFVV